MSMTGQGARIQKDTGARKASEDVGEHKSANGGAGNAAKGSGGGLPGLAAFSGVQGYVPTTASKTAPAEEPQQFEPDTEADSEAMELPRDDSGAYEEDAYQEEDSYQETDYAQEEFAEAAQDFSSPDAAQDYDQYADADSVDEYVASEFQDYDSLQAGQDYEQQSYAAQNTQLQTFEPGYDQHPEIPLGAFEEPGEEYGAQPFFHDQQQGDADFLDPEFAGEDMVAPKERRGRRLLMVGSGLLGALALGGALAFAYKTGGGSIASSGQPPLIRADSSPVKVAPEEPGGKQFPHKNKLIYDRLQGGETTPEVERLKPREEQVASTAGAGLRQGQPDAATGLDADKSSASAAADGQSAASIPASPDAGGVPAQQTDDNPRRVRTLTVRPDGSVVTTMVPEPQEAAPAPGSSDTVAGIAVSVPQTGHAQQPAPSAPPAPQVAAPAPQQSAPPPPVPEPQQVASAPAEPQQQAVSAPLPQPKPALTQSAPLSSATTASVPDNSQYAIQVAARQSQTDALAAFADLQQKYPDLLNGYRPMIQKADLGAKGIWYRLKVGPITGKSAADDLCRKLESSGMRNCMVRGL